MLVEKFEFERRSLGMMRTRLFQIFKVQIFKVQLFQVRYLWAPLSLGALGFYCWLLYWLLPVAVPTRLSADHLRWVFSEPTKITAVDRGAVVSESLNATWLLVLEVAKRLGLSNDATQLVPWAASVSSGVLFLSVLFLALQIFRQSQAKLLLPLCLVAFAPAVLWTAVIPNGMVLGIFFVVILAYAKNQRNSAYRYSVLEGFAAGITPAAWVLSLALALGVRQKDARFAKSQPLLRVACFVMGIGLHPLLKLAVSGSAGGSVSWLPVYDSLRAIRYEDQLAGPMVFLGPVGETATGLIASMLVSVVVIIFWLGLKPLRIALLSISFLLPFSIGHIQAWRIAHPGWNTVMEDAALNVDRDLEQPTIVVVNRLTEEAVFRFVSSFAITARRPGSGDPVKKSAESFMLVVTSRKIFDADTETRVKPRLPNYSVSEARAASSMPEAEMKSKFKDAVDMFLKAFIYPNASKGVPFVVGPEFVASLENPSAKSDLHHRYLMNSVRVSNVDKESEQRFTRENLKNGFVRAVLNFSEGQLERSAEVEAYERYALFHLALASEYNRRRQPADWSKRASAELYAALRKVPWLSEPYRIVCEAPELAVKSELELKGDSKQTAAEPLDVCKEIFKAKGAFGYGN